MKFFEEQERARRKSRQLVWLFILSLAGLELALNGFVYLAYSAAKAPTPREHRQSIYGSPSGAAPKKAKKAPAPLPLFPFAFATLGSLGIVLGAAAYRSAQLRSGGGAAVAQMAGASPADGSDPLERRFINVAQEMSLASGVRMPAVYVMRGEDSINAFAAGWSPDDAVVAVTRGCLECLSRDELQGVVAHEFSHVFNSDMRINMRAMGMLFGLYALAIVGREMLDWGRFSSSENKAGKFLWLLGFGFLIVGWVGELFGRLLSAAISRQREYLADASAVQFTRNPDGIGGALRKIAGLSDVGGSHVKSSQALALSHMYLGAASSSLASGLLASHPPIADRIERVYGKPMPSLDVDRRAGAVLAMSSADGSPSMGFAAVESASGASSPASSSGVPASNGARGGSASVEIQDATALMPLCKKACSNPQGAAAAALCLMACSQEEPGHRRMGLELARSRLAGWGWPDSLLELASEIEGLGSDLRVPLLDLAAPGLRQLNAEQAMALLGALKEISMLDKAISLREQALYQVCKRIVSPSKGPQKATPLAACQADAAMAVSWVWRAAHGAGALESNLSKGLRELGWGELPPPGSARPDWALLDRVAPLQKPKLAKAFKAAAEGGPRGRDAVQIACALIGCPAPYVESPW